ncbi:MAG: DUF4253 domain-containing protein [Gemmatimonadales bacterium]
MGAQARAAAVALGAALVASLVPACAGPRDRGSTLDIAADFAVPADFGDAVGALERLTGARARPLVGVDTGGDERATAGRAFDLPQADAEKLVRTLQARFLDRGFFLFRHEQHFAIDGKPDEVGLLPTPDVYDVLVLMGTNGWNYDIGPDSIVAWLRALEREQPFVLTGIGFDFVEGRFTEAIRDPGALAQRFYEFCPDIVDQGTGSVRALAGELRRSMALYCWWD